MPVGSTNNSHRQVARTSEGEEEGMEVPHGTQLLAVALSWCAVPYRSIALQVRGV